MDGWERERGKDEVDEIDLKEKEEKEKVSDTQVALSHDVVSPLNL